VGGVATHSPARYRQAVHDLDDAMVVWCGVSVAGDGQRFSLLSRGMWQFDLPDVELTTSDGSMQAVATLCDVLGYLARDGRRLPAGDTVGRTADEQVPVRYQPSPIDPGVEVMRLDFP